MKTKQTQKRYLTRAEHRRITERHYKNLNELYGFINNDGLDIALKRNIQIAFKELQKCSKLIDMPLTIGLGLKAPMPKGTTKNTKKRYLTRAEHRRITERHYKNLNELYGFIDNDGLDIGLKRNIQIAFKELQKCSKLIDMPLTLGLGLKAPMPKGMTKSIAKTIAVTGLRKSDGTLKKGYKYIKGGKIVKVKTA